MKYYNYNYVFMPSSLVIIIQNLSVQLLLNKMEYKYSIKYGTRHHNDIINP